MPINRNHFLISYSGNKRQETNNIIDFINKDRLTNEITTIIEPFCGTSAFSYKLSTLFPNKYKYILNDNDGKLMELYKICKDPILLDEFINNINELSKDLDKDKYMILTKRNDIYGWFIKNLIYSIRPGMYPLKTKERQKDNYNFLKDKPIIKFLQNENVELLQIDGLELYKNNKDNKNTLIFLDPPYMMSYNGCYSREHNGNIYEYLYNNKINDSNSYIILVLERVWVIEMIFKDDIINEYAKKYSALKKNTTHIIISNVKELN